MKDKKKAWWYEAYGETIAKIVKFGNLYLRYCKSVSDFDTDYQISLFDIQVIETVYLNEEKFMKMGELAEELGMTQSAFSKNVNKLVKMGLIKKYRAEHNKKDIFLRVTQEGKKTYETHSDYVYDKIFSRVIPIFETVPKEQIRKFEEIMEIMGEFPQLLKEGEPEKIKLIPVDEIE